MGICYNYMEDYAKSVACFDRSLAMRPDYSDASAWKVRACVRSRVCVRSREGDRVCTPASAFWCVLLLLELRMEHSDALQSRVTVTAARVAAGGRADVADPSDVRVLPVESSEPQ